MSLDCQQKKIKLPATCHSQGNKLSNLFFFNGKRHVPSCTTYQPECLEAKQRNFGNKAKLKTPCLSMESLRYELSHMLGFNQEAKLS